MAEVGFPLEREWAGFEPSLASITSDPIVLAVMAADGVTPEGLMRTINAMRRRVGERKEFPLEIEKYE